MLCVTFEYQRIKWFDYISDLLIGNGFGDIHNSKDIFIKAIGPNELLKMSSVLNRNGFSVTKN